VLVGLAVTELTAMVTVTLAGLTAAVAELARAGNPG